MRWVRGRNGILRSASPRPVDPEPREPRRAALFSVKLEIECEMLVRRRNGDEHVIRYDKADAELVRAHRWRIIDGRSGIYYAKTEVRSPSGKVRMPTLHVMLAGVGVYHVNGDGLDNRRANLVVPERGNRPPQRGNVSRYKGVFREGIRWRARIIVDGKPRHVGTYESEIEAALAYDEAARETWGAAAFVNFR